MFRTGVGAVYRSLGKFVLNVRGRRALSRSGLVDLIQSRPPDAYAPVWGDLWRLYRVVRELRPASVVELGSGCSTLVIAQALADNAAAGAPPAAFVSIEGQPAWAEATRRSLPSNLAPIVTVLESGVVPVDVGETRAVRYQTLPANAPLDFIYLDGPALPPDRRVAVDVLQLEPVVRPGCRILIDGRSRTADFLAKNLKRRWRRTYDRIGKTTMLELLG